MVACCENEFLCLHYKCNLNYQSLLVKLQDHISKIQDWDFIMTAKKL